MAIRNLIVCLHESFEIMHGEVNINLLHKMLLTTSHILTRSGKVFGFFFLNGLPKYQREKRFDKIFEAKCGMENAITSTLPCLKTVESRYKKPVSHLKSFEREGRRMLSIKTYPRLTSSSFYYLSLVSFFPKNFLECSPSPSFFVRSSGSSAYRYGQPSWFHMYRGGGRQGL